MGLSNLVFFCKNDHYLANYGGLKGKKWASVLEMPELISGLSLPLGVHRNSIRILCIYRTYLWRYHRYDCVTHCLHGMVMAGPDSPGAG